MRIRVDSIGGPLTTHSHHTPTHFHHTLSPHSAGGWLGRAVVGDGEWDGVGRVLPIITPLFLDCHTLSPHTLTTLPHTFTTHTHNTARGGGWGARLWETGNGTLGGRRAWRPCRYLLLLLYYYQA